MKILGVSLIGLVVGLAMLSVGFWFIERTWPALPRRRRPSGALRTDLIFWFATPFSARMAQFAAALLAAVVIVLVFAVGLSCGTSLL